MADGVDQLADPEAVRVSDRYRRQAVRYVPQSQQREVKAPGAPRNFGVEGAAVGQDYPDVSAGAPPGDHVIVRQHEAAGGPDHTCPCAPAAAPHLHDAPLRGFDHPRASLGDSLGDRRGG